MNPVSQNDLNDIEPSLARAITTGEAIPLPGQYYIPATTVPQRPVKYELSPGGLTFWAKGDRVLIEEDEFKSGYECETCDGSGRATCENCAGDGTTPTGKKCSFCEGIGNVLCTSCNGKGGLIIAPQTSQRRPTTGKIVSTGELVRNVTVGDSVMFSNFAGYVVDLNRGDVKVTIRILHESEILCGMEGHLTLSNMNHKSEIAAHTP